MSPTRATAVKFLQASPENPFATAKQRQDDSDEEDERSRFESARQYTYGGSGARVNPSEHASSPESGAKISMYKHL